MKDAKYRMLVTTLKADILSGRYDERNPFPSMRAIIKRFGLSKTTVQHALDDLAHQGLVSRKQGRGTFVTCPGGGRKIGLIVPDHGSSEFFPPIVKEISRLAQELDYSLLFGEIADGAERKRIIQVEKLAQDFVRQRVSGVIYQPIDYVRDSEEVNRRVLSQFDAARIPVVLCDYDFVDAPNRSPYDVVGINNVDAGMMMVNHLRTVGARKIGFHLKPHAPKSHQDYIRGAMFASGDRRADAKRLLVSDPDDVDALRQFLRRARPDALVCGNDSSAARLKKTLWRLGIGVPQDILLAGVNDLQIASVLTPPLTTIHLDCELIAATAFKRLLARIGNPSLPPVELSLPVRLVVRGSTQTDKTRILVRTQTRPKRDEKR